MLVKCHYLVGFPLFSRVTFICYGIDDTTFCVIAAEIFHLSCSLLWRRLRGNVMLIFFAQESAGGVLKNFVVTCSINWINLVVFSAKKNYSRNTECVQLVTICVTHYKQNLLSFFFFCLKFSFHLQVFCIYICTCYNLQPDSKANFKEKTSGLGTCGFKQNLHSYVLPLSRK